MKLKKKEKRNYVVGYFPEIPVEDKKTYLVKNKDMIIASIIYIVGIVYIALHN